MGVRDAAGHLVRAYDSQRQAMEREGLGVEQIRALLASGKWCVLTKRELEEWKMMNAAAAVLCGEHRPVSLLPDAKRQRSDAWKVAGDSATSVAPAAAPASAGAAEAAERFAARVARMATEEQRLRDMLRLQAAELARLRQREDVSKSIIQAQAKTIEDNRRGQRTLGAYMAMMLLLAALRKPRDLKPGTAGT